MKVTVTSKDIKLLMAARLGLDPKEIELEIDLSEPESEVSTIVTDLVREIDTLKLGGATGPLGNTIGCIKAFRAVTGLGLKDSKDIIDGWNVYRSQILNVGCPTHSQPLNDWLKR